MLEGLKALLGIGIAGLLFLILLGVLILVFWLWMLIESAKAKEWGWFAGMLITWVFGFGGVLMAILYYFLEYRKQREAKDERPNNVRKTNKKKANGKR